MNRVKKRSHVWRHRNWASCAKTHLQMSQTARRKTGGNVYSLRLNSNSSVKVLLLFIPEPLIVIRFFPMIVVV